MCKVAEYIYTVYIYQMRHIFLNMHNEYIYFILIVVRVIKSNIKL